MKALESTKAPKLVDNYKDIACFTDYFVRYNEQRSIDWFRYQTKVENLPRDKREQCYERLR